MLTRRRFLAVLVPGLVVASGGTLICGYRQSRCPLSDRGLCEGPCTAYRDADGDVLCDRLAALPPPTPDGLDVAAPTAHAPQNAAAQSETWPTADGVPPTPTANATIEPAPTVSRAPQVACPFGLLNDPYPGRCRRYADQNLNGFCDLSEPRG
jgi:hypothetical protein